MKPVTRVPLKDWVKLNLEIGALSFGGAGRVLLFQEAVVDKNKWMSEEDFQDIMTVSQVLPGANLLNLSIQLGLTLSGWLSATLGLIALGIPGALIAVLIVYFVNLEQPDIRGLFQGFSLASVVLFTVFLMRMFRGIRFHFGKEVRAVKFLLRMLIVFAVIYAAYIDVPLPWILLAGGGSGFILESVL